MVWSPERAQNEGKMPENEVNEVRDEVIDKFKLSDDYRARENLEDKWRRWWKLYKSIPREDKPEGLSNLFIPQTFANVETVTPRVMETLFSGDYLATAYPREGGDVRRAKIINELLQYQFYVTNFYLTCLRWIKSIFIYNIGYTRVGWDFDKSDPKIEYIAPWNVYPSPAGKSMDDVSWLIHRSIHPLSRILRFGIPDSYGNSVYQNVEELAEEDSLSYLHDYRFSSQDSDIVGRYTRSERKKLVEILEYWENNRVITIANRKVVLRDQPNPFAHKRIPFIGVSAILDPDNFYGEGLIGPCEYLQYELNDMRNMRMDNANLFLNNMFIADRNAGIEEEDVFSCPGNIIWTDDMKGILPIRESLDPNFFIIEENIKKDMQTTLGTYDYWAGKEPQRKETATGITSLQSQANARFKLIIRSIGKLGIAPLCSMLVDLNQQYMPFEKTIRIIGEKSEDIQMLNISPLDIEGHYDFIPKIGAIDPEASKSIRSAQLIQFLQSIIPLATQGLLPDFDLHSFIKYVIKEGFAEPAVSQFFEKTTTPALSLPPSMRQPGARGEGGSPSSPPGPEAGDIQAIMKQMAGQYQTP